MTRHAENTVMNYYKDFRSLNCEILTENDMVIGGHDVVVQIDEFHFGKRKFYRPHTIK